jgi:hypothetical protein
MHVSSSLHNKEVNANTISVEWHIKEGVQFRLPLAWWFGAHILKGELAMSIPRQNTLTLRHPSYLAIGRVLDFSHPFFKACKSNDVVVIREMLRNGDGRPTDEDPNGYGPLRVSGVQA